MNDTIGLPYGLTIHGEQPTEINTASSEALHSAAASQVPSSEIFVQYLEPSHLPLDKYWTIEEWTYISEDPFSISETIWEHVGYNQDANFPELVALRDHIRELGLQIYSQLLKEDVHKCAAESHYLEEETDILLDLYAPQLWGMDADRSFTGPNDFEGPYQKVLVYEDADDRKILCLHIHQLVFLGALSTMRDLGDSQSLTLSGQEWLDQQQALLAEKCVLPWKTYEPLSNQDGHVPPHGLKRSYSSASGSSAEPYESDKENVNSSPLVIPASAVEKRPAKRQKTDHDVPSLKEEPTSPKPKPFAYTGNCPLTASMLDYMHNYGSPTFDEQSALCSIEFRLAKLPSASHMALYNTTFTVVLSEWIHFRYAITAVEREILATCKDGDKYQGPSATAQMIQKSLLLIQLRQARDAYQASTELRLSAEHLLCVGFQQFEETAVEGEKVSKALKDGFIRLGEQLLALGESLGDGSSIFMGVVGTGGVEVPGWRTGF
ncbi:hypothetical protein IAQ61_002843 [Plenodomus lingam]|uniref:uncharacterized protein n=1 Tax=Leptosphaeria maculans TaxID=5022 RepID=UPI003327481A|nr:hypothetical protein IAQ61_002843 [Plenodomus lingam]